MESATDSFNANCRYSQPGQNFCNPCDLLQCSQNSKASEGLAECYDRGGFKGPRLSSLERDGIYHAKYFKPPNYFPRSLGLEIGQGDDGRNQEKKQEDAPAFDEEPNIKYDCQQESILIPNVKYVHPNVQMALHRCYLENRGPLLSICTSKGEVRLTLKEYVFMGLPDCKNKKFGGRQTLSSSQNDQRVEIEKLVPETFVEEQLEPFVTCSGHAETKWVVLINRGTTAIYVQWRSSPLFKGCTEEDGFVESMRSSAKDNKIQLFTERAEEFHFEEGEMAVLPGKTLKMPVLFQSKTAGWFYENLYLYTKPKLTDDQGRILTLRFSAVCSDEMTGGWNKETTQVEKVAEALREKLVRSQAMKTVDRICRLEPKPGDWGITKAFYDMSKRRAEDRFYESNPKYLNFRFHAAKEASRSLTELLKNIFGDQVLVKNRLCHWSLKDLYMKLVEAPITNDDQRKIFESEETELVLEEINQSTNLMLEPREVRYFSRNSPEGIFSVSKVLVSSMVVEMAEKALEIKRMMFSPERASLRYEYFRAKFVEMERAEIKCQAGESYEERTAVSSSYEETLGGDGFMEENGSELQSRTTGGTINRLVIESLEQEFKYEQRCLIAKLLERCSRDLARSIELWGCTQDYSG